jgi:hypothetical protein
MPTRTDITVVNQAYDTSGNGGRKLVRLSNGWLVAGVKNMSSSPKSIQFYKFDGTSWSQLCYLQGSSSDVIDFSLVSKGNFVYVLATIKGSLANAGFWVIDVPNQTNVNINASGTNIDPGQSDIGNCSLTINSAGTELHAAWVSKNSTYSSSFNIRYAKGTINGDGSVTWGAVEQWTTANGLDFKNPTIQLHGNIPMVFAETPGWNVTQTGASVGSSYQGIIVLKRDNTLTTHTGGYLNGSLISFKYVYSNTGGYTQSFPSACVAPNGRIWVAWMGRDATDGAVENIRVAYSDDGGQTWSAMTKLTNGNSYAQQYPSITVNKNNEVFVLWQGNDATDVYYDIRMIKYNGSWGSVSVISAGTTNTKRYPSALYDTTLDFSTPLFIYQDLQGNKVGFYGTWIVNTISVTPGYIGQKTSVDKNNLLTYAITTDGTMGTITEKINGITIATRTSPTSGQQFTVSLNQTQWDAIKFGTATLTIEMNGDVWTYTFDKRLNANDDILSAVKGVQDLQTHLNGIKAQLGAAIRAKGGTVNDTDPFSAFVSAVNTLGFVGSKKYASGSTTTSGFMLTVSGLSFRPKIVKWYYDSGNYGFSYDSLPYALQYGGGTASLISNFSFNDNGFTFNTNQSNKTVLWEAWG